MLSITLPNCALPRSSLRCDWSVTCHVKAPSFFATSSGKLEVLRVECDKCGRCGMYHLDRLIERCGIDAKLFDWEPEANHPRKHVKEVTYAHRF
jgi:hypothetical protein